MSVKFTSIKTNLEACDTTKRDLFFCTPGNLCGIKGQYFLQKNYNNLTKEVILGHLHNT